MNYTQNYHLPQWEESDRVMRTDFNSAMASLENGLTRAQGKADELPYVVGTYTGTGSGKQTITLGFRPSVVLIFCDQKAKSLGLCGGYFGAYSQAVSSDRVEIFDTGFRVIATLGDNDFYYPPVNNANYPYQYIAFR